MSRISVSCNFYLKDKPDNYLGITQESWNFGKNNPVSLTGHIVLYAETMAKFFVKTDTINNTSELSNRLAEAGNVLLEFAKNIREADGQEKKAEVS